MGTATICQFILFERRNMVLRTSFYPQRLSILYLSNKLTTLWQAICFVIQVTHNSSFFDWLIHAFIFLLLCSVCFLQLADWLLCWPITATRFELCTSVVGGNSPSNWASSVTIAAEGKWLICKNWHFPVFFYIFDLHDFFSLPWAGCSFPATKVLHDLPCCWRMLWRCWRRRGRRTSCSCRGWREWPRGTCRWRTGFYYNKNLFYRNRLSGSYAISVTKFGDISPL